MNRYIIQFLTLCLIFICLKSVNAQQWQKLTQPTVQDSYYISYLVKGLDRLILAGKDQIKVKDREDINFRNGECVNKKSSVTNPINSCKLNPFMIGSFNNQLILLSDQQILTSADNGNSWSESALNQYVKEWKLKNFTKPTNKRNEIFFTRFSTTANYIYLVGMQFSASNAQPYTSVIFRSDDLTTWQDMKPVFMTPNPKLLSISFVDDFTGWAVGADGMILHTIDGGENWKPQSSELRSQDKISLNDVYFIDRKSGWAVGDNGIIVATKNGGESWEIQGSPARDSLRRVKFLNERVGWAIGYKGAILFTKDGGNSWKTQNQGVDDLYNIHIVALRPTDQNLWSYQETDEWITYIVGAKGTLIRGCSSAAVCAIKDTSEIENRLSKNASEAKNRSFSQGKLIKEEKIRRNKEKVEALRDLLRTNNTFRDLEASYVSEDEAREESVRLSGEVVSEALRRQAVKLGKSFTDLTVIDHIVIKPPKDEVVVTDPLPDVGEFVSVNLSQSQNLKCMSVDPRIKAINEIEYSLNNITLKTNQKNPKTGKFTERAKETKKKFATGCFEISENQFLLSTHNGIYLSVKENFPFKGFKWDLITPKISPEDLLIREQSVAFTKNNIVVLASIYKNSSFIRNEIYVFDLADPSKKSQRILENKNTEYLKIEYMGGTRLEILSKKGNKMVSIDDGEYWREQK